MKSKSLFVLPLLLASPMSAQDEAAETPKAPEKPAQPAEPEAETDPAVIKINSSYGLGYNHGNQFRRQMESYRLTQEDIDNENFIQGLMDALNGKEAATSQEVLNASMLGLRNQVQEREKTLADENLKKANEFLAENEKREGVITTKSGLQYEVLKAGEGEMFDGAENSKFLVNYKGTLIDGSEFDASPEGSPVPMGLNVVAGFREALTSMPVGSKWKLYIKPELGYGDTRRSAKLAPNSVLIFELDLVEIQKSAPRPKAVSPPIQIPPAPSKEKK